MESGGQSILPGREDKIGVVVDVVNSQRDSDLSIINVNPEMQQSNNNNAEVKVHLPEHESAVLVKNLCKGYNKGDPPVLKNYCMNVKKGTIYGLLGSSGCGKTTALSCIVGLKKWESGEIFVFDNWWTKESQIPGKRLGYVPQETALYEQLSIKENIQYYGRLYGMRDHEILERWKFLVNLLLLPSEFKLVLNLSGGQRRRTSLALALIHSPELLILDEPTVGLDPLLRESVWKHLWNLVQNHGSTIMITTHYIEEARYANSIGVMRHGRLLVEDSPTLLMERHKTDLLEDVVLKLCWSDTNQLRARRQSKNLSNKDTNNDDETNASNAIHPNIQVVPNKRNRSSSKSSISSGGESDGSGVQVKFQSKWKRDLESIVVTESANTISSQGMYRKREEFDSAPATLSNSKHNKSTTFPPNSPKETRTKKWIYNALEISQRIRANCVVIYLSLLRHPLFFIAALVLPAIEVLLTITTVGKTPVGLPIGVVNEEIPDWVTQCWIHSLRDTSNPYNESVISSPDEALHSCNFNQLSCRFLDVISRENFLKLIPYDTTEDAENAVHRGDLWGYLHFSSNYSQHMLDRMAARHFSFIETLDGSTIRLRLDMSQYLGSVLIIQQMFDGLQQYIKQLIDACELGAEQTEIPLNFRPPLYGVHDSDYHSFIIPGVIANIMFMMPFAISAIMFITDFKLGTLGRSRVAGFGTIELMMTHCITQGSIIIGQIIIVTVCLRVGFNFQIAGSMMLYFFITLILGLCGQAFGLCVGIICRDEIEALITAFFILPTMLLFGGVLWPIEAIPFPLKYLGVALPTTLITESLRSTAVRGVGLAHGLVWPGILVTFGWGVFFWISCLILYRICIK